MNHFNRRVNPVRWVALMGLAGMAISATAQTALTNPSYVGGWGYVNDFNGGSSYSQDWTGRDTLNDGTKSFQGYCIDPKTGYQWGQSVYTTASLANFLGTPLSGGLTGYQQQFAATQYADWNLAYTAQTNTAAVLSNLTNLFSHAYADSMTSDLKAEAFGYVVWEIMGDTVAANSRTTGALRSSGSDATSYAVGSASRDTLEVQIDAYFAALSSASWSNVNGANLSTATNYTYTVYYDPAPHAAQNFLTVTPSTGGGSVPVPGSLALAGLGLMGVAGAQRRKAKH